MEWHETIDLVNLPTSGRAIEAISATNTFLNIYPEGGMTKQVVAGRTYFIEASGKDVAEFRLVFTPLTWELTLSQSENPPSITMLLHGPRHSVLQIEASTDLFNWRPIEAYLSDGEQILFQKAFSPEARYEFFRTVPLR